MGGTLFIGNQMVSPVIIQGEEKAFNVDGYDWLGEVNQQGELVAPTKDINLVFNGVKEITNRILDNKFKNDTRVKSASFPDLKKIINGGSLYNTFYGCPNLTSVDISSVEEVGNEGFTQTFQLTNITGDLHFRNLKKVGLNSFYCAFYRCQNLGNAYFYSLEKIGEEDTLPYANLNGMFSESGLKKAYFLVLSDISNYTSRGALVGTFEYCSELTDIYFNALNSNSFGEYTSQFNDMIYGCNGVTVHFPVGLDATIGNWSSVLSGFGGTNTTILYDL